jgi:hypothetical protein
MSDILFAIHLGENGVSVVDATASLKLEDLLSHDLQVDLLHVDLLIEFGGEFGRLQKPCVHFGLHGGWCSVANDPLEARG